MIDGSLQNPLGSFLNELFARYHQEAYLPSDPLEFVHRYEDLWDQEAVALLAAVLAYGNVKQIRRSVEDALLRMKLHAESPSEFVRSLSQAAQLEKAKQSFGSYVHRFNRGEDLLILFLLLSRSWEVYGSLGGHLLSYLEPEAITFEKALNALIRDWRKWESTWVRKLGIHSRSFAYLLTAPEDGSCCKRWCMLLRWMGRKDQLDPGLWSTANALTRSYPVSRLLRSDQLVLPLDTHTGRISQYLGLTSRKSLNWKAAIEVTEALKKCDPTDPTRYDFAISRLGILDVCQKKFRIEICKGCELFPGCRHTRKVHHEWKAH